MTEPFPTGLTARQSREQAFYDEFARGAIPGAISNGPVEGTEARPWNPSWYAYGLIRDLYRAGSRTLLDLGCGTGVSAVRFARVGFTVTGVDLSPVSLAVAIANAGQNGVEERVRLKAAAAEALPFPDESFDLIAGFDVLHHVEIEAAVGECLRVLKPGGMAVFKEWVEAPILDRFRTLPPVRWLIPRVLSVRREVTADERKLTAADLAVITRLCSDMTVTRFRLLARLHRFVKPAAERSSWLERVDAALFSLLPVLRHLGGAAVIILRKSGVTCPEPAAGRPPPPSEVPGPDQPPQAAEALPATTNRATI